MLLFFKGIVVLKMNSFVWDSITFYGLNIKACFLDIIMCISLSEWVN